MSLIQPRVLLTWYSALEDLFVAILIQLGGVSCSTEYIGIGNLVLHEVAITTQVRCLLVDALDCYENFYELPRCLLSCVEKACNIGFGSFHLQNLQIGVARLSTL